MVQPQPAGLHGSNLEAAEWPPFLSVDARRAQFRRRRRREAAREWLVLIVATALALWLGAAAAIGLIAR